MNSPQTNRQKSQHKVYMNSNTDIKNKLQECQQDNDNWQLTTPVALIIFNRPETTAKVFAAIRQAKPPKLLVIADGPRLNHPGEAEQCAAILLNRLNR